MDSNDMKATKENCATAVAIAERLKNLPPSSVPPTHAIEVTWLLGFLDSCSKRLPTAAALERDVVRARQGRKTKAGAGRRSK